MQLFYFIYILKMYTYLTIIQFTATFKIKFYTSQNEGIASNYLLSCGIPSLSIKIKTLKYFVVMKDKSCIHTQS